MRNILSLLSILIVMPAFSQVICIDPGHGYGPDGENTDGRTWEEITTNCDVGLMLRDSLETKGYTVILTRETSDTGSWLSLTQRAEIADEYESDRLLSIHCNAGGGTGTETFWCYRNSPNKAIDSIFSEIVQNNMTYYGEWTSRRSIEDAKYLGFHLGVLKGATPGCLNEIGFVDRPEDVEKLLDTIWRSKFAQAYRIAIDQSFEQDYPSRINAVTADEFQVYPNPFSDKLIVYFNQDNNTPLTIKIIDLHGRILFTYNINLLYSARKINLDIPVLPSGIYVLRISNSFKIWNKIVVKK